MECAVRFSVIASVHLVLGLTCITCSLLRHQHSLPQSIAPSSADNLLIVGQHFNEMPVSVYYLLPTAQSAVSRVDSSMTQETPPLILLSSNLDHSSLQLPSQNEFEFKPATNATALSLLNAEEIFNPIEPSFATGFHKQFFGVATSGTSEYLASQPVTSSMCQISTQTVTDTERHFVTVSYFTL